MKICAPLDHDRSRPISALDIWMARKDNLLSHQRWIWGFRRRSTQALKPRTNVTRSPKQRYQWPYKKDWCLPKFVGFYSPQWSWGKVIFSQVSVILFTGGSASVHARIPHPHPPGPGRYPQDQAPPQDQTTPGIRQAPPPPSIRKAPLGPDRHPPGTRPPPGPGRDPPGPGRHPPGSRAYWEIRSTSSAVCILLECNLVLIKLSEVFF